MLFFLCMQIALKLHVNCFQTDAHIGLAGPYQYFGWCGPGHTASAALAVTSWVNVQLPLQSSFN